MPHRVYDPAPEQCTASIAGGLPAPWVALPDFYWALPAYSS